MNIITDAACFIRRFLGIRAKSQMPRSTRYWMLGLTLLLPLMTGSIVWELVNPVSMAFRGIIFGMGYAWVVLLGIFLFELFVAEHGWCGRLCPVGAFYGLLGKTSLIRVVADKREQCDDCMDCFLVCPEPQVIKPALKGAGKGIGPVILAQECTNCGRCIDCCAEDVFRAVPGWRAVRGLQRHELSRRVPGRRSAATLVLLEAILQREVVFFRALEPGEQQRFRDGHGLCGRGGGAGVLAR